MKTFAIMALAAILCTAAPQATPTPEDFQILSDKTENGIRSIVIKPSPLICARQIDVKVEVATEKICDLTFHGGCPGNAKAVSTLMKGMTVREAIKKLDGNKCANRGTSCVDQLIRGLKKCYNIK